MALSDTVTAQLAAISTGQTTVLTAAITQAFNDGVASVASPTGDVTSAQEAIDIAAAVKAAVDPLNTTITAANLAKTTEDALLAAVKASVTTLLASLG